MRSIRTTGATSARFPIFSGVPQGCPASPLFFLLITEAFSRLVLDDEELEGIKIYSRDTEGEKRLKLEVRLSQFADDTLMYLRNFLSLPRMWFLISIWEGGTGMKANQTKTEGLRAGSLRRKPIPPGCGIAFPAPGEWVRSLGIPFWEQDNPDPFWEALYLKTKTKLSHWYAHSSLTHFGRRMIVDSMIWSRPRYWSQCMIMPSFIRDSFLSDAQALMWSKDVDFDPDELGTQPSGTPFFKSDMAFMPKTELGLGCLHWPSHEKALRVKWLLRYIDPSRGEWKDVLDVWLARAHEGRGSVFANYPRKDLVRALGTRACCLPTFWRAALSDLFELDLKPVHPLFCTSPDEARAEPFWDSHRFHVAPSPYSDVWRTQLELNSLKDLFLEDGSDYSLEDIREYLIRRFERQQTTDAPTHTFVRGAKKRKRAAEVDGELFLFAGRLLSLQAILDMWCSLLRRPPISLLEQARGRAPPTGANYSETAHKIMRKMGWTSGGLGSRGQGIAEPVAVDGSTSRAGLGHAARARARATKPRKKEGPSYCGFIDDSGDVRFAQVQDDRHVLVVSRSTEGKPLPPPEDTPLLLLHTAERRSLLWLNGGILGIAAVSYTHLTLPTKRIV